MSNKKYNIEVTESEFSYILEGLLYSCSLDVTQKPYREDLDNIKNLLIRFRKENPEVLTENVIIVEKRKDIEAFRDIHTNELLQYFPEMVEKVS